MPGPDFEAEIRFLTKEEGGRQNPPFQGYRPDLKYKDQAEDSVWMIWPMFLDENGNELPKGEIAKLQSKANMYIINKDLRETVHRQKIIEGVSFYLVEGNRIVATGTVTQILSLKRENADPNNQP